MTNHSSSPKVSVIVLNWNGKDDTIECLSSLCQSDYDNFEIVVVDNGSSDDSVEALRKHSVQMVLLQNSENLGFSEGNNVGINYALSHHSDYVLLLNNDTTIDKDALSHLVEYAESDESIGIVGPKILFYHDRQKIWFAGGVLDFVQGASHRGGGRLDDGDFDEVAEVDYITGCALLIKRKVILDIGLMSNDFFLLFEETDWCLRARKAGYKLFYVPKARVYHKCSASFGRSASTNWIRPPSWIYYYVRNNFILISKHLSGSTRMVAYYNCAKRCFHWVDWGTKVQNKKRLLAVLLGLVDFLAGRYGKLAPKGIWRLLLK